MKLAVVVLGASLGISSLAAADADEEMGRRVQLLLRARQAEVFACVAKQSSPVEGEALLRVLIGPSSTPGRIPRQVEVLKVEPKAGEARAVADCVAAAARAWDLSALGAGEGDQVVFPLAFRPERPGAAHVAVQARLRKLELRKGARSLEHVVHPTAWYVVRGELRVRLGAELVRAGVGDVVYLGGEGSPELRADAPVELIVAEGLGPPGTDAHVLLRAAAATPAHSFLDGKIAVRLYLDGQPAPFALDQLCAKKGAVAPRHAHATDELLYILAGRGEIEIAGRAELQQAGNFVTIPRGTPHALRVDEDLCAVQLYTPPGPEQRFKQQPPPQK